MATLQLSEAVITAVVSKLNAGIAARISAINAEFSDSVVLTTPTVYPFGVSPPPPGPLVIVTDGGSGESQIRGEGSHSLEVDLQVAVLVKEDDANRNSLGRRLLRLERAAIETLWDDAPKGQLQIGNGQSATYPPITPTRVIPGPVFRPENNDSVLSSFRIVVFTVTKREN